MRLTQQLLVFRLGAFTLTVAALAGCASMPSPVASNSATGYGSTLANSAYSTGQACYAPSPDLKAAYNQPYEIDGQWYHPMRNDAGFSETGIASWYDRQSSSAVTAMGTAFHARQLSAASRTLPLPSCVRVTNLQNGRSVIVLVDDRGPFVSGRIMDLSAGAANVLGMLNQGTSQVRIQVIPSSMSPQAPTPQIVQVVHVVPRVPQVTTTRVPAAIPLPDYAPSAHPQNNLTAVVDQAFASHAPHRVAPQPTPIAAAPRAQIMTRQYMQPPHTLRQWHQVPRAEQVYLETAQAMALQTAVRERSKLQDFGISTAKMVPVASATGGGLYKIKIGPMARTAAPQTYVSSLQRLRLGNFVVSEQAG